MEQYAIAPGVDRAVLADCTALVLRSLKSADPALVLKGLYRLSRITARRAQAEDDAEATFAILVEELCEFPTDVVEHEMRSWGRREKFFPTLAELRDMCQRGVRRRQNLLSALRRA